MYLCPHCKFEVPQEDAEIVAHDSGRLLLCLRCFRETIGEDTRVPTGIQRDVEQAISASLAGTGYNF